MTTIEQRQHFNKFLMVKTYYLPAYEQQRPRRHIFIVLTIIIKYKCQIQNYVLQQSNLKQRKIQLKNTVTLINR